MNSEQLAHSVEAEKSQTSSVCGVNRRTAVLFANKTPRRSVARTGTQPPSGELRTPRRPGRPPKQAAHTVGDTAKTSERSADKQHGLTSEHTDEDVSKKRGRKKRSDVQSSGEKFGSQWGEVLGSVTTQWSTVARTETNSSTRRSPQKESFRQYRVLHDSDTEGLTKSDNDHQMASLSSSSSSTDSSDNENDNSASHDDDVSSSSSSSPPTASSGLSFSTSFFVFCYLCCSFQLLMW